MVMIEIETFYFRLLFSRYSKNLLNVLYTFGMKKLYVESPEWQHGERFQLVGCYHSLMNAIFMSIFIYYVNTYLITLKKTH